MTTPAAAAAPPPPKFLDFKDIQPAPEQEERPDQKLQPDSLELAVRHAKEKYQDEVHNLNAILERLEHTARAHLNGATPYRLYAARTPLLSKIVFASHIQMSDGLVLGEEDRGTVECWNLADTEAEARRTVQGLMCQAAAKKNNYGPMSTFLLQAIAIIEETPPGLPVVTEITF